MFSERDRLAQQTYDLYMQPGLKKHDPNVSDLRKKSQLIKSVTQELIQSKNDTKQKKKVFQKINNIWPYSDQKGDPKASSNKENIEESQYNREASETKATFVKSQIIKVLPPEKVMTEQQKENQRQEIQQYKQQLRVMQNLALVESQLITEECDLLYNSFQEYKSMNEQTKSQIAKLELQILNAEQEFENEIKIINQEAEAKRKEAEYLLSLRLQEKNKESEVQMELENAEISLNALEIQQQHLETEISSRQEYILSHKQKLKYIEEKIQSTIQMNEQLEQHLLSTFEEKANLNQRYLQSKPNTRVFCRVKPILEESEKQFLIQEDEINQNETQKSYQFRFDRIFDENAQQNEIFEETIPVLQSLISGVNVCMLSYGQSGTGKSYTLEGQNTEEGLIYQSLQYLLNQIQMLKNCSWEIKMYISFQEVYQDQHKDLLTNIPVGDKMYQLSFVMIQKIEDFDPFFQMAQNNRKEGDKLIQDRSKNSHCIYQIKIVGKNQNAQESMNSTLNIVQLAGCDKLTEKDYRETQDSKYLNLSLTALSDVIVAMNNFQQFVPFRNSKLTYILHNYLSPNSQLIAIICVSQHALSHRYTLNSLRFAEKISIIRKPQPSYMAPLVSILKNQIPKI